VDRADDRGIELEIAALDLPEEWLVMPTALRRRGVQMAERHRAEPHIDLDAEDLRDRQGRRVTEEYAEQAVEEALGLVRAGRPSLGATGAHSPRVSFRVPEQVRRLAEERAAQDGRSVSEIAREALERYLRDAVT